MRNFNITIAMTSLPLNRLTSAGSSLAAPVDIVPEVVRDPQVPAIWAAAVHAGVVLAAVDDTVRVPAEVHSRTVARTRHSGRTVSEAWTERDGVPLISFRRYKHSDSSFCACAIYVESSTYSEKTKHFLFFLFYILYLFLQLI